MEWVIGVITVLGFIEGIYTYLKVHKVKGLLQVILAVIFPILTVSFCSLKGVRAFGGTDFEFLVHSATIDGEILPWFILILFIAEIICIIKTVAIILNRR